jgi:hypothetical protein
VEPHHQEEHQGAAPDEKEGDELVDPHPEEGPIEAGFPGWVLGSQVVAGFFERIHNRIGIHLFGLMIKEFRGGEKRGSDIFDLVMRKK